MLKYLMQRLHHAGFVVRSIEEAVEGFTKSLCATWDEKIIHDPLQGAKVTFLQTPRPGDGQIELVEPVGGDSPVGRFLAKGGGLHHLCYEVDNVSEHLKTMRLAGGVIVRAAMSSAAFEKRLIAWVWTRQKLLLEFLESAKEGKSI